MRKFFVKHIRTIEAVEIRRLNTLRGLAALIVVVSHYSNESRWLHAMLGSGGGQLGVMLFFMLSGFLMSYLYIDQPANAGNIRQFAVARLARVVPLYVLVVTAVFVTASITPDLAKKYLYDISDWQTFVSHLLLLYGNDVLWTVPIEIHFYVLFAIAWWLRGRYLGVVVLLAAISIALRYAIGFEEVTRTIAGFTFRDKTSMSFPYFVSGACMGWIYLRWRSPIRSQLFLIGLLIIPMLYPEILRHVTGLRHGMWEDWRVLLLFSTFFFSMVFLVPENSVLIENRIGDFLGKISYSAYLLHYPLIRIYKDLGLMGGISGLALLLLTVLLVSWAAYQLVEAPFRRGIRKRFQLTPVRF